jgi:hypothetical protein
LFLLESGGLFEGLLEKVRRRGLLGLRFLFFSVGSMNSVGNPEEGVPRRAQGTRRACWKFGGFLEVCGLLMPGSDVGDRACRLRALFLCLEAVLGTELAVCGLCSCLEAVLGTELAVCGLCPCLRAVLGTELAVCGAWLPCALP